MAFARAELTLALRDLRREVEDLYRTRDLTPGRALDLSQSGRYALLVTREVVLLSELAAV